jgi:fructose transport system permease protein
MTASAKPKPSGASALSKLFQPPFGPLIFFFVVCLIFTVVPLLQGKENRFLTAQNFALIFQQTAVVGVLAIGQTLVILTSGIDLSNGLIMALTSVIVAGMAVHGFTFSSEGSNFAILNAIILAMVVGVIGYFASSFGFNRVPSAPPIAKRIAPFAVAAIAVLIFYFLNLSGTVNPILSILIGLFVAGLAGFINGTLVTRLKLPPFIVTLGTLNIAFALTRIYSTATINGLPEPLLALGESIELLGARIPLYAIVMLLLFFLVWFVLRETRLGRHIYAVGDNKEAAELVGIPVNRILLLVYTGAGVFYGIAAILLIARQENGDPQAGQTSNLESITAVVLGGTSLFGGRGHIMGTLIGALVVSVIRNGLTQAQANPLIQTLITGILVIAAVALDQFSQRAK